MARILVLGKFYPPYEGGIEVATRVVCERLAQHHQVTALAFNHKLGSRREMIADVTVERASVTAILKSQPLSLGYLWRSITLPADLIIIHAPNVLANLGLLIRLAFRRRPPIMVVHHMEIYGRPALRAVARFLYNRLLGKAACLVVTSRKNAEISQDIRYPRRFAVIPLGIDPASYQVTPELRAQAAEWRHALVGNRRVVGFVGRHARYKGLDVLVRATLMLSDVHLVLAGDGPYRAQVEALAAELGLSARITFLGAVSHDEKLKLLLGTDVFAFPSTEVTEAFGISQLEAMLLGVPVVASDLPTGVTDVAVHGETALVARVGDADHLAARIRQLLDDPELALRLASAARLRAETVFSIERTTQQNVEAVEALLAYETLGEPWPGSIGEQVAPD